MFGIPALSKFKDTLILSYFVIVNITVSAFVDQWTIMCEWTEQCRVWGLNIFNIYMCKNAYNPMKFTITGRYY